MVLIKVLLSNGLCGNTIKDLDGFFCPLNVQLKFYNLPNFKNKYKNVYLLRIDERNTKFRLHDFYTDTYHYNGYITDFILYLEGADFIYQVYLEPKGYQLLQKDEWKEKLLESIDPDNVTIINGNDGTKLYGVKFYSEDKDTGKTDIHKMFPELREKGILPRPDEFKLE